MANDRFRSPRISKPGAYCKRFIKIFPFIYYYLSIMYHCRYNAISYNILKEFP